MFIKLEIFLAILFIVFPSKNTEEIQESNDVQSMSIAREEILVNEDISETKRKHTETDWGKNITALAIIQTEQMIYEKLKPKIDEYHTNNKNSAKFLIYPGTLWCGAGSLAWSYSSLGLFRRVDMCCRDHDYCPQVIYPLTTKYGLTNNGLIIQSHCTCDLKFYDCLKAVGSTVARDIGQIYFNTLGNQCFKEYYPIVRCKTYYTSTVYVRCKEYEYDFSKPQKYQFFDVPLY